MVAIGHRGAMGYEPENTLRSLRKALELDVDIIEFDVHLLKDGEVILMHDDTVDRTTNGKGFVSDMTLSEIKKLDAGKGEQVPTLQEAMDLIDGKSKVIIEISGFLSTAQKVAEIIRYNVEQRNWRYEDIMVSSFNHPELQRFKKLLPEIKIGANTSGVPISYAQFAKEVEADFLTTENIYLANDSFIKHAHEHGIKFYLYTLNTFEYLARYEEFGIDGVISNFPDRFLQENRG